MFHKDSPKCFKKSRKSDDKTNSGSEKESVHEKNLHVASLPLVFVFNILRSIIYLLFVIVRYLWKSSSKVLLLKPSVEKPAVIEELNRSEILYQELVCRMSTHKNKDNHQSGDPLLAKQKEHHRRAFEFISKALKIDEENEGMLFYFYSFYFYFERDVL